MVNKIIFRRYYDGAIGLNTKYFLLNTLTTNKALLFEARPCSLLKRVSYGESHSIPNPESAFLKEIEIRFDV